MKPILAKTQKRIEEVTDALEAELGISDWWIINHHFVEGHDGDTEVEDGKVRVFTTGAATTTQWEYRIAKITWYLGILASMEDFEIAELAIHEYVHVLNAPIAGLIPVKDLHSKLEEYVTETLARVIIRARGGDCPA